MRGLSVFGPDTPSLWRGVLLGLIEICNLLELSMKSEYRQAVEAVIAQEAKLAEVKKLHTDAAALEKQFSESLGGRKN